MKSTRNGRIYIIYLAILCFYLWMAAQIPYTHDDWDWGLDVGMQQFLHATVNSRYSGNFFEIVMTRSEFLKIVIMGVSYFLLPYLLVRIVVEEQGIVEPQRKLLLFLLCNCMLLSMNQIMWRQVYGWVAGFANFAISAVFLMLWIYEMLRVCDQLPGRCDSIIKTFFYFIASVCGQLFLENIALYCTLLACVLIGVYYYRYRKIPLRIISMSLGALVGLLIMFSSNIYGTLFSTGSAVGYYRVIPIIEKYNISAIKTIIWQGITIFTRLYFNNILLSVSVLGLFSAYMHWKAPAVGESRAKNCLTVNCLLIAAFVCCYLFDGNYEDLSPIMFGIDFIVSASYYLIITLEVIWAFSRRKRAKLLALWMSVPTILAPLLITIEAGFRLFFTSNVFVILFALMLLAELLKGASLFRQKRIGCFAMCAAILLFVFYGRIYKDIGECKRTHENIIQEAICSDKEKIVLPKYPHDGYLHCPYPEIPSRIAFFKAFYGISDDTELKFE